MDKGLVLDWTPILFVGGIFLTVITGLLTWIGILQATGNKKIEVRMDKQDAIILRHDEEIHELALMNRESLTILKHKLKIK